MRKSSPYPLGTPKHPLVPLSADLSTTTDEGDRGGGATCDDDDTLFYEALKGPLKGPLKAFKASKS